MNWTNTGASARLGQGVARRSHKRTEEDDELGGLAGRGLTDLDDALEMLQQHQGRGEAVKGYNLGKLVAMLVFVIRPAYIALYRHFLRYRGVDVNDPDHWLNKKEGDDD